MEPTEEISKKAEVVLEEVKEKVENAKEAGKQTKLFVWTVLLYIRCRGSLNDSWATEIQEK